MGRSGMHDENPGIVFPDRGWVELDLIPEVSTVKSARRAVAAAHPPASAEVRAKRAVSPRVQVEYEEPLKKLLSLRVPPFIRVTAALLKDEPNQLAYFHQKQNES